MKVTFPFFRCLVLSLQLYIFYENWKRLLPSPVPLIIDPCIIDGPSLLPHCLLLWHGRRKLTLTIVRSRRRWWHPLQYSCLANPMGGGAWWAAVHGVANSQTWLSDFAFTFHFHALEKEMAAHSSVLAWRIPGTGEPDGLPSMGLHRVGHDWSDLAAAVRSRMCICLDIANSVDKKLLGVKWK